MRDFTKLGYRNIDDYNFRIFIGAGCLRRPKVNSGIDTQVPDKDEIIIFQGRQMRVVSVMIDDPGWLIEYGLPIGVSCVPV